MNSEIRVAHSQLEAHVPEDLTIKIIGLGGVGAIVARYLAMFLASLGSNLRLVLIDGDSFEASNAHRMFFSRHGNKAQVTREDLIDRFVDSGLTLVAIPEYVTPETIESLVHDEDLVLVCVDNHATRKVISDFCASQLQDVCLISAGNDGIGPDSAGRQQRGTFGNVQVFIRRNGIDVSPSLTMFHPEIDAPTDALPTVLSCSELIVSVPQVLFTNLATASAMLNALLLYLCNALHYSELSFDIADGLMRPLPLPSPKLEKVPI